MSSLLFRVRCEGMDSSVDYLKVSYKQGGLIFKSGV